MFGPIKRFFNTIRRRSFDAASGGRRWEGARTVDNLNASILASATTAARRAGYYARNNSWAASGINSIVANSVGTGIRPRSKHPSAAVRAALHSAWDRWCAGADVAGLVDFYGMQALAVRAMVESGESFVQLVTRPADGGRVPLQLRILDREQVPLDRFADLVSNRCRAGIEFDEDGRRVAYQVLPHRPGDPFMPLIGNGYDTIRVPAEDLIHLFQPLESGQLRGITWLAPCLLRMADLDAFEDASLVKSKVAALFAGFIVDPQGTAAGQAGNGTTLNGVLQLGMEPGSLIPLPSGADIRFSEPADTADYTAFTKSHIRAIAAGLGVPYEAVSGDLEGVSYSSVRAGLVEFRRRIEQLQWTVIIHQLCRPVWERFVTLAILSGTIDAPDFEADPAPYLAAEWLPPKFDYVDPSKDIAAEVAAINAGLKARSQAIAERGYDSEAVDAEIAADREREQRLGLRFPVDAPAAPTPQEPPAHAA